METIIYKGGSRVYDFKTGDFKERNWRDKFTKEQVEEWMKERERFMYNVYDCDRCEWVRRDNDGYSLLCYRDEKKSPKGRQLKRMAVIYFFLPSE